VPNIKDATEILWHDVSWSGREDTRWTHVRQIWNQCELCQSDKDVKHNYMRWCATETNAFAKSFRGVSFRRFSFSHVCAVPWGREWVSLDVDVFGVLGLYVIWGLTFVYMSLYCVGRSRCWRVTHLAIRLRLAC
jgi:hypothetical protein